MSPTAGDLDDIEATNSEKMSKATAATAANTSNIDTVDAAAREGDDAKNEEAKERDVSGFVPGLGAPVSLDIKKPLGGKCSSEQGCAKISGILGPVMLPKQ
jgi:hypothetical protein